MSTTVAHGERGERTAQILGVGMVLAAIAIVWYFRLRGWYAHDEGTLGQAAERMLRGEIPHRDFDDPYTGGLAIWHALAFRLAGIHSDVLRSQFALVTIAWVIGIYWLARRWLAPFGAGLVALTIAVWSVPLYPVPMPSWYVLFLTTAAATLLVVRHDGGWRLFAIVGALVGVAALAKITAAIALAGAGWAMVALRQREPGRRAAPEIVIAALLFAGIALRLMHSIFTARVVVHIAAPALALVAGIAIHEWRTSRHAGWGIDLILWQRLAALAGGAAVPVLLFGAWLAQHHALAPFVESVRSVVGTRAHSAAMLPPSVQSIGYAVPVLLVVVGAPWLKVRARFIGAIVMLLAVLTWFSPYLFQDVWQGMRGISVIGALIFAAACAIGFSTANALADRGVLVFAPIAAVMCLTQFPFAAPIYYLYVFPLVLLAIAAAVGRQSPPVRMIGAAVATGFLLFGVVQVLPGAPSSLDSWGERFPPMRWLQIPRARLYVPADEADIYDQLVAAIDSIASGPIWAGPDAPEVAFLSGRRDLDRSFFMFTSHDTALRTDFARSIAASGAVAVVINTAPSFSKPFTVAVADSLRRYFPRMTKVERFQIFTAARAR